MYSLTEHLREAIDSIRPHRHDRMIAHTNKPAGIGGILMAVLLIAGLIWVMPEIRRYARMTRM